MASVEKRSVVSPVTAVLALGFAGAATLAFWARAQTDAIERSRDEIASECKATIDHLRTLIVLPKAGDVVRTEVGYIQITDPEDYVQRTLLLTGGWERDIGAVIDARVKKGATALDVGAYIGTHTLPIARAAGPEGHVYAFDPSMAAVVQLRRNLALNDIDNVTVVPKALGRENTSGFIGTPVQHNEGANVACTLQDIESGNLHCAAIADQKRGFEMVRLDDLHLSDVSFIKIDVEGHELDVLRGGARTVERDHPVIVVEVWKPDHHEGAAENRNEVRAFLEARGYALSLVNPTNFLAVPSEAI